MIKVGICGFGYWGPNLYRNFTVNPDFEVVAVSDPLADCRDKARRFNRQIPLFADTIELIDSGTCDAVAIATPVATRYGLAAHALRKRLHVLVEKPFVHPRRRRGRAPCTRNGLMKALHAEGIATRRGVMASHLEPPYRNFGAKLPHTEAAAAECLQLPMHSGMNRAQADIVLAAIDRIYRRFS